MTAAAISYVGPDRRGVLAGRGEWVAPLLVVLTSVTATALLRGADGDGSLERALALHSLSAAILGVMFLLGCARWHWFGDARAAYLGVAALGLLIACGVLTFGHSIEPLWDERLTRAFLVSSSVLALAAWSAAVRSPQVDTSLRASWLAGAGVLVLAPATLVAYPFVSGLSTDTVSGAVGALLLLGGSAGIIDARRRPMFGWTMAAAALVGLGQLVHLLPSNHEQVDLLLVHVAGLVICVVGSLAGLQRSFLQSEARGSAASLGREAARRSRASIQQAAQVRDHELRNAVLALDGATSVAMSRARSEAELAAVRDAVEGEFARLRALLERDLGRPTDSTEFDLVPVLREQVTLARGSGPDIRLDVPVAVTVHGDPAEAAEIVQNLLLNAARHAPSEEGIDVFVDVLAGVVEVTVADRGPGIPPGLEDAIIRGRVPSKVGSGLGLHICATIARRRGGRLSLHTRPGGGAMVRLQLPRFAGAGVPVADRYESA